MSEPRLPDLARSFERHLRAENKSDRTEADACRAKAEQLRAKYGL